jgi:trimeric autotransporter adhesin
MRLLISHLFVAIAITYANAPVLAQQDDAGIVTAVNQRAISQTPHGPIEQLVIGHHLVPKEKLTTLDKGRVQLLFADQSALTMGENTELIIDEFAFDPKTGAGQIAATIANGSVHYVGNAKNPKGGAEFSTPSGTVTIAGDGVASIRVRRKSPSGSSR